MIFHIKNVHKLIKETTIIPTHFHLRNKTKINIITVYIHLHQHHTFL